MSDNRKTIGIVQPSYLPWIPFFERMYKSDVFVVLDDVKYSKNSFFNRNAIKSQNGRLLLTIPVLYSNHSSALINEIHVDSNNRWKEKHIRSIQMNYSRAPYYKYYHMKLEEIYAAISSDLLIDALMPFILFFSKELHISTPIYKSSEITVSGTRNEKLVNLCKYFGGTHFLVKPGTESYHPKEDFQPYQVEFSNFEYAEKQYPQLHGPFEHFLSVLDFLMNVGPCNYGEYVCHGK